MNKLLLTACILLYFETCDFNHDKPVICSEMFAAVTVRVEGKVLDDFYTIRPSTNEIVRHDIMFGDSIYTVLNDNYVSELMNDQDTFVFYGFYRGEQVIKEDYVIRADECHVEKVSGKDLVVL